MDVPSIQSILRIFFIASICLLPVLVAGAFVYSTVVRLGQQSAHEELGKALGFSPLNRAEDIQRVWYGGQVQGRDVVINTIRSAHRYHLLGRSRRGSNSELRIAMAVRVKEPLGVTAYRDESNKSPLTFEETFTLEQGQVSPAARVAMLAFAFLGHPTGLRRDLRVAFVRGTRNLRLNDRASIPKGLLGGEILAHAKTILVHDHPFVDLSPAELTGIIEELGAVAQAIETDIVPPLLEDKATPPPEGYGRSVSRLILGFVFMGLPVCFCFCAAAYAFLDANR